MISIPATYRSNGHKLCTPNAIEECRRAAERLTRRQRKEQWESFCKQWNISTTARAM